MDLYKECLKMKVGQRKTFIIDRDLEHGELAGLIARLTIKRPYVGFSAIRSGREVKVYCYIPK